jgi:2-polyprenyl-6-methoxyphenol hydroxylase-like FAD-dependent oxidoreductase
MTDEHAAEDFDVVVVGASIAGCTAATLYGRAGLHVALVERNRSIESHKALCGHFVLGGAKATLERLGLWQQLLEAGAATSETLSVRTPDGWITGDSSGVPAAISLRRSRLDPLLRRWAAATPGVELLLGHAVTGVLRDRDAVTGVVVTVDGGAERHLRGRLVVGADGHRSPVATLAGVPVDEAPNERFLFWAYYRGVTVPGPGDGHVWRHGLDAAVSVPTDDGLTLVGAFPTKERLPAFMDDRVRALEAFVSELPDGPLLTGATRESKVIGTTDYPCLRRDPAPLPGLALVGDAATAGDPVPAVGCGWAFRTAEWLADATAPALRDGTSTARAMRRYRKAYRFLRRHDDLGRKDALALPPNRVEQLVARAAVADPDIARRIRLFGMKAAPPSVLMNPAVLLRAWRVAGRAAAAAGVESATAAVVDAGGQSPATK